MQDVKMGNTYKMALPFGHLASTKKRQYFGYILFYEALFKRCP